MNDVLDRLQSERALAVLYKATTALSGTITKAAVGRVIAEQLVEALNADMCAVFELSEDGMDYLLLHSIGIPDEITESYRRFSVETALPTRDVLITREPIFIDNLETWAREYDSPRVETGARAAIPLLADDRVIGAVTISLQPGRTFSSADRQFVMTVAIQCAQALERARLYEAEHETRAAAERARDRTAKLQEISSALSFSVSQMDIAHAILGKLNESVGANRGGVYTISGDVLTCVHAIAAPEILKRYERVPLDGDLPLCDAVRRNSPVYIESPAEWARSYAAAPIFANSGAWAALPLVVESAPIGALTLAFDAPREFGAEDREFILTIAHLCAQALERARLYDAEREARRRAEEANLAKSEFLNMISHELRTPLNAVIGYAELLLMEVRGPLTPDQQHQVEGIRSSATHQLTLIEDILDYASIDAGKVEVRFQPVNLVPCLMGAADFVRQSAEVKGVALRVDIPADHSLIITTDPAKVRQILLNLLSNAVKFTSHGQVEVTVSTDEQRVNIRVRDTGPGIPADKLDYIWQPFVQLHTHASSPYAKGTGLGLPIAATLAQLLGGSLTATSEVGVGSTFELSLPRIDA